MDDNPNTALPASNTSSPEEEVERLFVEARDDIYRYSVILGLTPEQAQEVAQEVFLRLFADRLKGGKLDNPRGWLFRVAHNLAVRLRTRERIFVPLNSEIAESLVDDAGNPELGAMEREQKAHFEKAVESLSSQQQECLYLRAEGFRYRDIATIMGISDSSVGEFLRRGINRLKKALNA